MIFCDEKRNPSSELIPYYGSHDTSSKVRTQIRWSDDVKTAIWTEIVSEKIRKQSAHLKESGKHEALLLDEKVNLVLIEDSQRAIIEGEKTLVVDNDFCLIDLN